MTSITTGAKERMTEIYKITSILTKSQVNDFEEILKIACDFLEIESGIISNIKGSEFTVLDYFSYNSTQEDIRNKVFDINETFSSVTLTEQKIIAFDNFENSIYKDHPFLKNSGVKVYIGVPLWINNEISGTLSFFSRSIKEKPFSQEDLHFIQYLGQWISNFLHKTYYERQIAEKNKELEKLNGELEKNNEILSKNIQEKEHLSQILVHDLKSPLSNIQMLSYLFEELVSNQESEELLVIFNKSLQDVFHLINQMETLNEVENASIKPYLEDVDVNNLIANQITTFSKTAEVKNIDIQFSPSLDVKKILSDINVLKRVINNLLSNAIKFSDFNKVIQIGIKNEKDKVIISVQDQGPGILIEEENKLFKRFSKLSNKPTNNESSSGLGLYIVKELLEKLNSSIEVKSTRGEGSTFIIHLSSNCR